MISTSNFKKGTRLLFKNEPFTIIDFQHVKPGKGGAFVRTKLRNILTGAVLEETFRAGEKFQEPDLEYRDMQYLYEDNGIYNFMDQETYEQITLNKESIIPVKDFLKEQFIYNIILFNEKPVSVTAPIFIELKVIETTPGVKGDTAQGSGSKPAKLETGLVIPVPLFIKEDDIIKIDTRSSEYIERVK